RIWVEPLCDLQIYECLIISRHPNEEPRVPVIPACVTRIQFHRSAVQFLGSVPVPLIVEEVFSERCMRLTESRVDRQSTFRGGTRNGKGLFGREEVVLA